MAFLRAARLDDELERIRGKSLMLRLPEAADYEQWSELRSQSRSHLIPWEPSWLPDDLSRSMYRRRLRAYAKDVRDGTAYPFFIFDLESAALVGGITLSNIKRGSSQSASLGYWMGSPYAGAGRMQEAVRTLLPSAFSNLRLNRIEAATMPANTASIRVLENCGFEREGLAKAYLKINGRYEDHYLYARISAAPDLSSLRGEG